MEKDGVKFGCLCIDGSADWQLNEPETDLGSGFFFARPWSGVDLKGWTPSLGSWRVHDIEFADLWVWTTAASRRLDVTDLENEGLADRMQTFWKALQLCQPAIATAAWIFTGTLHHGRPDIATLRSLPQIFVKEPPRERGIPHLKAAASLTGSIERAFAGGRFVGRVERGLTAFFSGMRAEYLDESVLCLERALEGIFHPNDRRQFVARGARVISMASQPGAVDSVLGELYDLRSGLAHAESLATIFPGRTVAEAVHRSQQLQTFAYLVASRAHAQVLQSPALIEQFASDELGEFWGKVATGRRPAPFTVDVVESDWLFGPDAFPGVEL